MAPTSPRFPIAFKSCDGEVRAAASDLINPLVVRSHQSEDQCRHCAQRMTKDAYPGTTTSRRQDSTVER